MPDPLFPKLGDGAAKEALRFGDHALTYGDLAAVAGGLARDLPRGRVAV